jgi:hypothetical protein
MSETDRGFSRIEREHVEQECRPLVANATIRRTSGAYFVRHEGQELSAKSVIRQAFRFASQREIDARRFSVGRCVARIHARVGFEGVVHGGTNAGGE